MAGVELIARACDGHVVVALRGEMDITGAVAAEAALGGLVARGRYTG